MAIITEHFFIGEREFIRTYSNAGVMIHGGFPEDDYEVAEDPAEMNRTYTETNIPIDDDDIDDSELVEILLGGES